LLITQFIHINTDIDNFAANAEAHTGDSMMKCMENEQCWRDLDESSVTLKFSCVRQAMDWIDRKAGGEFAHIQVLVCGSIRLMGAVMWRLGLNADNLYKSN